MSNSIRLLRLSAVLERVQLSKSEVYRRIDAGEFPMPVKLGLRSVAFVEREVDEYIAALVAARKI